MTENEVITEEKTIQVEDQIGGGIWSDGKPTPIVAAVEEKPVIQEEIKVEENPEEIVEDGRSFLKEKLGYETWESAKEELETLRTKTTTEPIKFENEESETVFKLLKEGKVKEVKAIYDLQEKLEGLTTGEVNKDNAPEIIKMGLKDKFKNLNDSEIEFEYKQAYKLPKEPKIADTESDEDFEERVKDWKEQCADIEASKIVNAKKFQPELEKLKSQIKLPDISKPVEAAKTQQTQEELDAAKKAVTGFIDSVQDEIKSLTELSIEVKDEVVKIPVSYSYSQEEKTKVVEQLKKFAESNFDANAIFAERWVKEDGTINVSRMTQDMIRLNNSEKIDAKLANDGASKRLKEYTKEKKNIQLQGVNGAQASGTADAAKAMEQVEEAIWNK